MSERGLQSKCVKNDYTFEELETLFWKGGPQGLSENEDVTLLSYLAKGLIFEKEEDLMLRCRMTGAELSSSELRTLAKIAKIYGGGYADVTTRANFQIREISFSDGIAVLRELLNIKFVPAVAGLNNLRNVTVSPTSGFGKYDLVDVLPLAKEINEQLLYNPVLQGLPGKFNISLDSGGAISVASESNDIGLLAYETEGEIRYRMSFADIRKGETIASDSGWALKPEEVASVVASTVKLFLQEGNFKVRLRSRLKFLIEQISLIKFKQLLVDELGYTPELKQGFSLPNNRDKMAHCGVREQKNESFCYVGVVGATGRLTTKQMTVLAYISDEWGAGTIRLTTRQTCIIPFLKRENIEKIIPVLKEVGLSISSQIAGAIVACTGSKGCSYSATDTKLHSKQLMDFLDQEIELSTPINIHFTGCSFSCAQTYIGDIGLLGVKSKGVMCYHLFLGGGADQNKNSQKVVNAIPLNKVNFVVRDLLVIFKEEALCGESFNDFIARCGAAQIVEKIQF